MKPQVSVLTSYYNAADNNEFFFEAYNSLEKQGVSWEWIIQCNRDMPAEQREAVAEDERVHIFCNPYNLGTAVSKNRALIKASSPYVFAFDDDDILPPDALGKLLSPLKKHPECFASFGHCYRFQDGEKPLPFKTFPEKSRLIPPGEIADQFFSGEFILTAATLLWRREYLEALGGWAALYGSEDTALVVKASALWSSYGLSDLVYLYRINSSSTTHSSHFVDETAERHDFIKNHVRLFKKFFCH